MKLKLFSSKLFMFFLLFQLKLISGQTIEQFTTLYGSFNGKIYEGSTKALYFVSDQLCKSFSLYKSLDEGISWTKLNNVPTGEQRRFDVGKDGTLLLAVSSKVYYSIDQGMNWNLIASSPNDFINGVYGLSNGGIMVMGSRGSYKSLNKGNSWDKTVFNFGQNPYKAFYEDQRNGYLYYCNASKLYLSKDQGKTWSVLLEREFTKNAEMSILGGANNLIYVTGSQGIWTFDVNANYKRFVNPLPGNDTENSLCQLPNGRLLVEDSGRNLFSDDEGKTWKMMNNLDPNFYSMYFLSSTGKLFANQNKGNLVQSSDEGLNWTFSAKGILLDYVYDVMAIDQQTFVVSAFGGYYLTRNNGQDFELVHGGSLPDDYKDEFYTTMGRIGDQLFFLDSKGIYQYDLITRTETELRKFQVASYQARLLVNDGNNSLYYTLESDWYKSEDFGKTWIKLKVPTNPPTYEFFKPVVLNGQLFYMQNNRLFRSSDNAKTWTLIFTFADEISNLKSINSNQLYLIQTTDTGSYLLHSFDNGQTWIRTSLNISKDSTEFYNNFYINNKGDFFISEFGRDFGYGTIIYRSIDHGQHFEEYYNNNSIEAIVKLAKDQRLYVLSGCFFGRIAEPTNDRIAISGKVFADDNKDCNFNGSELGLANVQVQVKDATSEKYYYSNSNGDFVFEAPVGNFEMKITGISKYQQSCTKQLVGAALDPMKKVEIGLQEIVKCPELFIDLSVPRLRRCFETSIFISYKNMGTDDAQNAYLELSLDDLLIFKKATITPSSINGKVIRFDLGVIKALASGNLEIKVEVSCNARLGAKHCVEATIYPHQECNNNLPPKIKTSAICRTNTVELFIENINSTAMSSPKAWNLIEYDQSKLTVLSSGNFLLKGNEKISLGQKEGSRPKLFIAEQVEGNGKNVISQTEIHNCLTANAEPQSLDEEDLYYDVECVQNVGSFDPNDITGFPIGITDAKRIHKDQELEYTIRFQNTGTDTAFNVNLINNLEKSGLDLSTLELGASSHPYTTNIINGNTLVFAFKNIMLPDSNINSLKSNAFVRYKIKPKKQILMNDQIKNSAEIFFDYNDAVLTNEDHHTIGFPLVTKSNEVNNNLTQRLELYPNPINEQLKIQNPENNKNLMGSEIYILDAQGKTIWQGVLSKNEISIDCHGLNSGVYCVRLKEVDGTVISGIFIKN